MKIAKSTKELQSIAQAMVKESSLPIEKSLGKTILVTGGSGFLGIHLLYELVLNSEFEKIYTIVRSTEKLKAQALKYIGTTDWLQVVHPIEQDLLHITAKDLPRVSLVIHSAAEIHCLKSLTQLYSNNCEITANLLNFYRNTPFIFISSLSVFVSSSLKGYHCPVQFKENDTFDIYGGYAQSKYVGELLCQTHNSAKVVRLGLLTGSTIKGICGHDFFTTFLKICKEINCYPSGYEESFVDITPVDMCAQKVIHEVLASDKEIVHIANKNALPITEIISQLGLQPVTPENWTVAISSYSKIDQILMNYAFFKTQSLNKYPNFFNIDLFQSTGHYYSIKEPFLKTNKELLSLYLDTLRY